MAGNKKPSNNNISSISGSTNIGNTTNTNNNGRTITKNKSKTRDSDCCSINFIKYVLHIFNIIFFVSKIFI